MPRQPRLDAPGLVHHVMARGIDGQDIFRADKDREAFLERLGKCLRWASGAKLFAWVLMSNHFHLLIRTDTHLLSPLMRRLMTGHAVNFNLCYHRKGHLFQNRYKSIVVEEESYFLELVRYIHLNPVRAGIVDSMQKLATYAYSGHAVLMESRQLPVQDKQTVLERFSGKRAKALAEYEAFVAAGFAQGKKEQFQGGGLIRSMGGLREAVVA